MKKNKDKKMSKALLQLVRYIKDFIPISLIALVCAFAGSIINVLVPDRISDLTKIIQQGLTPSGVNIDLTAITHTGILIICMLALSFILSYLESYITNKVSCAVSKNLRNDLVNKVNKIPLKYYDEHNFGDTLSRITNDVNIIGQSLGDSVSSIVIAITTLIGSVIMMFVTEWRMAFVAIISSLLGFVLMSLIMAKSQKYFLRRQDALAGVNSHIEEYFAGQNIVRAYNAEDKSHKDYDEKNKELKEATFKAELFSGLMPPLMTFIGNFGYVAVCIVGATMAFNNIIGFEVIVAFMIYVRLFTSPLSSIAQGMSGIQSAASASERVFEFLNEKEEVEEKEITNKLENIEGNISFDHIKFGYNPDNIIIKDFSLDIKKGNKVAIVGPTGAGKTTLVNLLMRFYELNSGSIRIDGVKTTDITRENVHDLFGMVLQDTWLFTGSLRDNLTYGKEGISDETLLEICDECGLSHFVNTLPNGLDTVLDDNVTISQGQKQLLTIARAMVENSPMLILDEATSNVDTRTELKIQKAMDTLTKGRTSFVIAHRLSTIKNADVIIYMQNGDIKEVGTHDELISKKGLYFDLYNSQFANS